MNSQPSSSKLFQLLSMAAGLAIGNLYISQPLLGLISNDFAANTVQTGWLVSATQFGYAVGIILLVPLGDMFSRRLLIPLMMTLSGIGLLSASVANSYEAVLIAFAVVGITTISGQFIMPLTGDLSTEENRGRNIGVVVSGIMIGILASRSIAGGLAGLLGWQGVFRVFGIAILLMALLMRRSIPDLPDRPRANYIKVVADVFLLPLKHRQILVVLILNGIGFALFSSLWTSITFLLSAKPYSVSAPVIGLFSFVGLVGALIARKGGKLYDKGWADTALVVAWVFNIASFAIGLAVHVSLIFLVIQLLVFDAASQINGLMNQTRLLSKFAHVRSRVNASYVSANFIGGALGSAGSAFAYSHFGWDGVMAVSIALGTLVLIAYMYLRRTRYLA
jgi:predicted MFS family arabinose efflux permease